jgi:hypothetical protein
MKKTRKKASTLRSVWLLARPLSAVTIFPPFAVTSQNKFPLCHWGVLITKLDVSSIEAAMREVSEESQLVEDLILGIMWELHRTQQNTNTVNVSNPFKLSSLKSEWVTFSAEKIGTTLHSDAQIQREGKNCSYDR